MSSRLLFALLLATVAASCWGESTGGWDADIGGGIRAGGAARGPAARLSRPPRRRCAAGRRAALPLRAGRSRAHPAAALGPGGAHPRGASLRRTRSHVSCPCPRPPLPRPRLTPLAPQSHDEAGPHAVPQPFVAVGEAARRQIPQQVPNAGPPQLPEPWRPGPQR